MTTSEAIFGGSPIMVSNGPSSRGFVFRYVLPAPSTSSQLCVAFASVHCVLPFLIIRPSYINSVQTRRIVKGEAQKSPLFWRISGSFRFSQDRLWQEFHKKTLKFNKSPIFTNTPCKSTCLYSAPSMHIVDYNHATTPEI